MTQDTQITVTDIFDSMEERFRPEGAAGVTASFGYDIKDTGRWRLTVRDGAMTLEKNADLAGCDVVLQTDGPTFLGINLGKIDGLEAIAAGKMKVDGEMSTFALTTKMFRKFMDSLKIMKSRDCRFCNHHCVIRSCKRCNNRTSGSRGTIHNYWFIITVFEIFSGSVFTNPRYKFAAVFKPRRQCRMAHCAGTCF